MTSPTTAPAPTDTKAAAPAAPSGAVRAWPVLLLALPAFCAVWSGWVGLGELTGFGVVHPLPGIADDLTLNTAITLPIGVETYAAYALRVWLTSTRDSNAARFAKWSALGSLALGAAGQVAYHLMEAAGIERAPWQITAVVACLPVAVLGMGAALAHLTHHADPHPVASSDVPAPEGPQEQDDTNQDTDPNTGQGDEGDEGDGDQDTTGQDQTGKGRKHTTRTRTGRGSSAGQVIRLRARHPEWTVGQIALKAGVTERTARRHLNATPTPDTATGEPVADAA